MKKKNLAFTLAEVLIVIGIIGVVAALTLPNLNHATGDKEAVTKVKKIYASLTDAVDRAQIIYGNADTWFKDLRHSTKEANERVAKRITEFMKVSKDCGFNEGCFSSSARIGYDGSRVTSDYLADLQENENAYMVTLSDGTSLAFYDAGSRIFIRVDIDGPNKGKNTSGRDLFDFMICYNLEHGCDIVNQLTTDFYSSHFGGAPNAYSLSTWIIENGNLDYLKADPNDWTCNDSNIILDGTTNTSCH